MSVSSRDNNFPINALHKFIVVYVFVSFVSHFIPYPMALALRCPSNVAHGNHSPPYETACLWRTSYSPHDRWRPRTYGINDRILYIWAHGQKLLVLIWRNMLQWQVNIIIKGTYMSISSFFFGFQLDKTAIAFFFARMLLLLLLLFACCLFVAVAEMSPSLVSHFCCDVVFNGMVILSTLAAPKPSQWFFFCRHRSRIYLWNYPGWSRVELRRKNLMKVFFFCCFQIFQLTTTKNYDNPLNFSLKKKTWFSLKKLKVQPALGLCIFIQQQRIHLRSNYMYITFCWIAKTS